jgi:hypothetical protein
MAVNPSFLEEMDVKFGEGIFGEFSESNQSQDILKVAVDSIDNESVGENKFRSVKYPSVGGINPKEHLFQLTDYDLKSIFPLVQTSNKPTSINARDTLFLLLVKITCSEDICQRYFVAPPPGVSKRNWVCVFGHTCKSLKASLGGADIKAAIAYAERVGLTVIYKEEEGFEQYFVENLSRVLGQKGSKASYLKKCKDPQYIQPINFVSLFPLNREEDKKVLREVFGDIPNIDNPNSYFACPHHFNVITRTGAVGLSRKIVMNIQKERRGGIDLDTSNRSGARYILENLIPKLSNSHPQHGPQGQTQGQTFAYPDGAYML